MRLLIKAFLLLLPFFALGQNKTYLGLEIGPKFEVYQYIDNGDGLYTKPFFFSPIYGLTVGQELNKVFTVETGFFVNDYGESYRIQGECGFGYMASNAITAFQIPLRLKARLNLIKERLSMVTSVGYTLAINNDYDPNGSSGSGHGFSTSNNPAPGCNDSTRTQDMSTYHPVKTYGLIETGLALEYTFKNSLALSLSTSYLTGFQKIVETEVKYWINDEPEQTGTAFSNGDYFNVVFGVRYPISNFWTK